MKKSFIFNRIFWIGVIFFVALLILLPHKAQLQNQPGNLDLPPRDSYQKKGHPKMEYVLYRLMETYFTQGLEKAKEYAEKRSIDMKGDLVRVIAEARTTERREEVEMKSNSRNSQRNQLPRGRNNIQENLSHLVSMQIEVMGGNVETTYRQLVQAVMPIYALQNLADLETVKYLRLPLKPILLVTSEGVEKTCADEWQDIDSYRQTENAKVCVLDAGFDGYEDLLGTELPSSVTTRSFRSDGDIYAHVHGTACAEIVHDMAPEAELFLVNFGTEAEHGNAVDWIIEQGVDIISYSMGWKNYGAGDGTGPICEDVENAANNDIIWISAAGNSAEDHWEGTYNDTDGDDYHNFESTVEILYFWVPAYYLVSAHLNWDDWGTWDGTSYSGSDQDYELELYYYNGTTWQFVDGSYNWQNGTQWPTESISGWYSSASAYWGIAIYKHSATRDVKLEVFIGGNSEPIAYNEPAGSLLIPADSPYAVAVGAVDWSDDSYHSYSSRGPTSDGEIKPDICAPSGVSGVTYGTNGFYGTSASTPHVAGAFALLKGILPYTLDDINEILEARVIDLGTSGKDNMYGHGRLNLSKETSGEIQFRRAKMKSQKTKSTKYKKSEFGSLDLRRK